MRAPIILMLAAGIAGAQDDAPIKVNVNVVNVLCTVRNKAGGLVGNLQKSDFTLFEDGKQQEIKYFTRETDLPLTIGLLIDVSASQERLIDIERNAAHQFFTNVLRPKDEAFLISFGAEAELLQDDTNSPKLLLDGLNQLHLSVPVGGLHPGPVPTMQNNAGTILYDAVFLAADEKLRKEVGRKAIVVITDGVDTGSKYTREKAIQAALKADSIIYSIFYQDVSAYGLFGGGGGGKGELQRMSADTGGRVFDVDRRHTLDDAFREIQDDMRSQYAIGYTPSNSRKDGTFRKIDLRVAAKDDKVQTRKGYFAIESDN
ncbi:MAG TPA: VWA domain-containing protein [Bryobacteraceae bacterium]